MQWILLILGVILAVVAVFALQNPDVVNVRFLNLSGEASVLVVILIAYAAGVVSGVLALLPSSVRKSARLRKLRSEVKNLEKQLPTESAQAKAEKGKPDQRRFREVEAESARVPVIEPQPQPQPPVVPPPPTKQLSAESQAVESQAVESQAVESPGLGAGAASASSPASSLVSSTESAADGSFSGRAGTAGSSLGGEGAVDVGASSPESVPDPDAEPPAGAAQGWRRFLGL